MSSLNGLFPEIGFRLVESLGAGSFSDVAETHLYTFFLYVLHLKYNKCKIMLKNKQLFWIQLCYSNSWKKITATQVKTIDLFDFKQ